MFRRTRYQKGSVQREKRRIAKPKPPRSRFLSTAIWPRTCCAGSGTVHNPMPSDWVFGSPTMRGKQPYWPDNLMKRYIRPVAKKAGIHKQIGWHTFRHTFGTLLKANGEDIKTVQELLRHANSRITLEVYTQAVTSNKRAAQSKVVKMMVANTAATQVETPVQAAQ